MDKTSLDMSNILRSYDFFFMYYAVWPDDLSKISPKYWKISPKILPNYKTTKFQHKKLAQKVAQWLKRIFHANVTLF